MIFLETMKWYYLKFNTMKQIKQSPATLFLVFALILFSSTQVIGAEKATRNNCNATMLTTPTSDAQVQLNMVDNENTTKVITRNEKKESRFSKFFKSLKSFAASAPLVLLIVLSFLIPFLAVGIKTDWSMKTLICLLLTLLFWIPGVVYALLVVLDAI